jgi:hypothetical protein
MKRSDDNLFMSGMGASSPSGQVTGIFKSGVYITTPGSPIPEGIHPNTPASDPNGNQLIYDQSSNTFVYPATPAQPESKINWIVIAGVAIVGYLLLRNK